MQQRPTSGLSLMETVIAIGIITMALLGALALIIATIHAGTTSVNRLRATNLAREGIEIIRAQRDSNWMKMDADETDCNAGEMGALPCTWDFGITDPDGIYNTDGYTAAVFLHTQPNVSFSYPEGGGDIPKGAWYIDRSVNTLDDEGARLHAATTGHLVQYGSILHDPALDNPTQFQRLVSFYPICVNITGGYVFRKYPFSSSFECDNGQEEKVGIQVIAEVQWREGQSSFTETLEEHLFNWR